MSTAGLTPPEAARWAARAGLPLPDGRHSVVAATADHIHSVVTVLRELDFGDTPAAGAFRVEPAGVFRAEELAGADRAGEEGRDAAV
ncbi:MULTISPECIES: hypothetical protein [unclassified Streptomyces]|uniref:hypothetical protein n=1 Tax=unclassified Streptomyces TaxID=2593676 RepID=UPI0006903C57|nr:hypothetical protein [Streptomyces sp. NRRL F-5630]